MLYINILTTLILIGLFAYAAYCNAVMDTLDISRFSQSVYFDKNPMWYQKETSWKLKHDRKLWLENLPKHLNWLRHLPFMDSFSDHWHFAKTKMIFSLTLCVIMGTLLRLTLNQYWVLVPIYILLGTAWIQTFNYYYNNKLKKTK